jgi:hypothetical protein
VKDGFIHARLPVQQLHQFGYKSVDPTVSATRGEDAAHLPGKVIEVPTDHQEDNVDAFCPN